MAKVNGKVIKGIVTEALPNTMFRIDLEEPPQEGESTEGYLAYLSGKMKLYRIKVLIGDTVEVLIDEYGGKGRVIKRL